MHQDSEHTNLDKEEIVSKMILFFQAEGLGKMIHSSPWLQSTVGKSMAQ